MACDVQTAVSTMKTHSLMIAGPVLAALIVTSPPALATPGPAPARLSLRDTLKQARREFQVYRGKRLERWSDRMALGRNRFDSSKGVKANLEALAKANNLPHHYAEVGGRQVLHIEVELGKGRQSKRALRSVLGQIGDQTIELNYKASSPKNRWGHVAVRLGGGATYDLTGTRGVASLPKVVEKLLTALHGTPNLSMARKRNLRRFFESRNRGSDVYYGMLFAATPQEQQQTEAVYSSRLRQMTSFNVHGGNGDKGVYSCAQFLSEKVPFLNQRGIQRDIGAKGMVRGAMKSNALEAIIVYKLPESDLSRPRLPRL